MKKKFISLLLFSFVFLLIFASLVVYVDPLLVYHEPQKELFIPFDNERYQNNGIVKQLDYDGLITGTSLTENFRTSQFDAIYDTTAIKVPFSGSTFFEGSRLIERSYNSGTDLKYVLRSFDLNHIIEEKDTLRTDLGEYPDYIINDSPWDDYKYLLNKDIFLGYVIPILKDRLLGKEGGHTNFDEYSSWRTSDSAICDYIDERGPYPAFAGFDSLTEDEKDLVNGNVYQNVIKLAQEHPQTQFIYYIAPYSIVWWGDACQKGMIKKYYEAESLALSSMLKEENIHVYCFSNRLEITENLSNYCDEIHYNYLINDEILNWISNGEDELTSDNYMDYLNLQYSTYSSYDYNGALF